MYNLFLDDFRHPVDAFNYTKKTTYLRDPWEIVHSYDEFVDFINEKGLPKIISFDHDLAEAHYTESFENNKIYFKYSEITSEKTGYHCAKWLIEYCIKNNLKFPTYYVHSMNPIGAKNIISLIENFEKYGN